MPGPRRYQSARLTTTPRRSIIAGFPEGVQVVYIHDFAIDLPSSAMAAVSLSDEKFNI